MKVVSPALLCFLVVMSSCLGGSNRPAGRLPTSDDYLIVPGSSVGKIALEENTDSVNLLMGKPDFSDAAMGKVVETWYHNQDSASGSLSVYAARKMGVGDEISRIKKIKITASDYRTREGIGAGDSLINIARIFIVRPIDTFRSQKLLYTTYGTKRGMTFIINPKGVCNAIIIHSPSDSESTAYLPFY